MTKIEIEILHTALAAKRRARQTSIEHLRAVAEGVERSSLYVATLEREIAAIEELLAREPAPESTVGQA